MTDQELTAAIREVQERARANAPAGALGPEGVMAADLMPLVHARDAAESKVAAIGTVNPRPPGFKNNIAQAVKKFVARALDWHVREQVEFNRASMMCVQATIESLTTMTRSMAALSARHQELQRDFDAFKEESREQLRVAQEMRASLAEFEQRAVTGEIRVLRTISELQVGYQYRANQLEQAYKHLLLVQHHDFQDALEQKALEVQKRLWEDLANVRQQFEGLIHRELKLVRQKPMVGAPATGGGTGVVANDTPQPIAMDWHAFAHRFRGSEERIRAQQGRYIAKFLANHSAAKGEIAGDILDIGCGRGEFLEAAREAGLRARGIELSQECVDVCTSKGLTADCADMFSYLESQPDASIAGLYCAQVIEHISPAALVRLTQLVGRKLQRGALAMFETPNPECLAIFATHFYIDPTHTRPVPAGLLHFYLEEAGFGAIEVEYLEPAEESLPAIKELPSGVRELFFGGLDYSIIARKL